MPILSSYKRVEIIYFFIIINTKILLKETEKNFINKRKRQKKQARVR